MDTASAGLSAPSKRLLRHEWAILSTHHPNILVFAPGLPAEGVIQELTPVLRPPLRYWDVAAAMSWPVNAAGSLIVRDVAALDATEQRNLHLWLNQRPAERTQVLSVTPVPLFPLMERGAFLDALYYRLNVLHLTDLIALG
ncbi:MAG: hypothetical protein A3G76_07960 [Acidobacteria bacterium RIFCSPLOWO2_12_FULL_65_11]|nr:MAG: hypothetical protein A3H95_11665 [Acidobacteria bacterium RIFCSPLOWO2_02_FULL_64_15]OFW31158.1 MAG: hypothetical protein A3G76_07960 [Acidobacteria bacterium RIFCSPLOWO2_12_FULL_65_11]